MEKDFTKQEEAFAELLNIMETLREKCPWDHKQTMESLRTLSVEEVYELGDAILKNDMQEVKKELGDLLMHIVFYALIGKEQEQFDGCFERDLCQVALSSPAYLWGGEGRR